MEISLYENIKDTENKTLSIENYITFIQTGADNVALIEEARRVKASGDKQYYTELKQQAKVISGSCTFISGQSKKASNIQSMNGLILLDIDDEQVDESTKEQLQKDPYTFIMHKSFGGGQNYVVFVKIDHTKFDLCFDNLAKYYYEQFGILIDQACKNKNRLRFMSYDPDIFVNEKARRWKPTPIKGKEIEREKTEYIFFEDDFGHIMNEIQTKGINLVQGDYSRYIRIGFALYSQFGDAGEQYFKVINEFNPNQNRKRASREWKALCKSGTCNIGTFYYYCKEAGIEVYSEKTKTLISLVKTSKVQGSPTISSVKSNAELQGYAITERDENVIQQLIDSKIDYSKLAFQELKEIEILEKFILDTYDLHYNELDQNLYCNGKEINDTMLADIFLTCKKHLDLKKDLTERNIDIILKSSAIKSFNPVSEFFAEHYNEGYEKGFIKAYADCIQPYNEFNYWAFKKWMVGMIHNWTCGYDDNITSPLTLVLTGSKQGIGKTSFVREILPKELLKYKIDDRINLKDKDSMFRMGTSLMLFDDEFGGKSIKDDKEFKNITEKAHITLRRPFTKTDITVRRRTQLIGCTNEIDVLKDVTGNRRILPIDFQGVEYEKMLGIDKIKMLCEAYGEYISGFNHIIIGDDIKYLAENTQKNVAIIPFEEMFFETFSLASSDEFTKECVLNQGNIKEYFKTNHSMEIQNYEIRNVLLKNNIEYKSNRIGGRTKSGILLYAKNNANVKDEWVNKNLDTKCPF